MLLSDALWRRRFGADPSIVGKAITLNGVPHTVVGVMGPDFQYPAREFQVWTPLTINPGELTRKVRGNNNLAVARLKPGVTVEEAQSEMSAIAARIAKADPQNVLPEVIVVPTHADLLTNVRSALYVMLAAVLCLLLVAALNLATLLSARAASRSREHRGAAGARRHAGAAWRCSRWRKSCRCSRSAARSAWRSPPTRCRRSSRWRRRRCRASENIRISIEVLLASIAVLSVTGLIATLLPAAQAWSADLTERDAGRDAIDDRFGRVSRARAAPWSWSQIALALPLLVGGVLLTRTFAALNAQSPGFERDNILTAHLAIPRSKYRNDAAVAQVEDRILESVAAHSRRHVGGHGEPAAARRRHVDGDLRVRFAARPATPRSPRSTCASRRRTTSRRWGFRSSRAAPSTPATRRSRRRWASSMSASPG